MNNFNKAYKFASEWLWDSRGYGSVRRTTDRGWDNQRLCDVADMLKDYTKEQQYYNDQLEGKLNYRIGKCATLKAEVERLRKAIVKHADERVSDHEWMDDQLWQALEHNDE